MIVVRSLITLVILALDFTQQCLLLLQHMSGGVVMVAKRC